MLSSLDRTCIWFWKAVEVEADCLYLAWDWSGRKLGLPWWGMVCLQGALNSRVRFFKAPHQNHGAFTRASCVWLVLNSNFYPPTIVKLLQTLLNSPPPPEFRLCLLSLLASRYQLINASRGNASSTWLWPLKWWLFQEPWFLSFAQPPSDFWNSCSSFNLLVITFCLASHLLSCFQTGRYTKYRGFITSWPLW